MELLTSGKRILYTRNLAALTRGDFCNKYDIPIITLRSWEASARIKPKAAERFCLAITKENIYCDPIWLMSGTGRYPHVVDTDICSATSYGDSFDERINQELEELKKMYKHITHQIVTDDAMYPLLSPGDYIAGYCITDPNEHLESICIIETSCGQNLTRIVNNSDTNKDLHILSATNAPSISLYKQKINNIIKVIWMRKRN